MHELISSIVSSKELHPKWLNALSFLENCGVRKIAACQHPTRVKEEILKHAAEEFRHAHYLKKQIARISAQEIPDYSIDYLLGGRATLNYLPSLDLQTSRYLKYLGWDHYQIKEGAYLLDTYAIELRAEALYPIYDTILRHTKSKINVKSILIEEKQHLLEMEDGLKNLSLNPAHINQILKIEEFLNTKWIDTIKREVLNSYHQNPN